MPRVKIFRKLDASSFFWQTKLDVESSKLCTFNSPFELSIHSNVLQNQVHA